MQIMNDAKAVLMERNGFSEEEAHRYIQKRSMDNGTNMVETAYMVFIQTHFIKKQKNIKSL